MAKFRAVYTEEISRYVEIEAKNEEHAYELLEKYFQEEEKVPEINEYKDKSNSDYELIRG